MTAILTITTATPGAARERFPSYEPFVAVDLGDALIKALEAAQITVYTITERGI